MSKPRTETIEFQGVEREYDVWDKDYWVKGGIDAPRYWIMHSPNQKSTSISSEVKQDYRKHMVFHELFEFESDPKGKRPCVEALKAELERVPQEEMPFYIPFRTEVFRELIAYWQRQSQGEPRDTVLREARESLEHLRRLGSE